MSAVACCEDKLQLSKRRMLARGRNAVWLSRGFASVGEYVSDITMATEDCDMASSAVQETGVAAPGGGVDRVGTGRLVFRAAKVLVWV